MSSARLCRTIDRIRGFLWLSGGPPVSEREGSVIHRPATLEGLRHAFRQVIDLMRRDPLIPPSGQAMAAIACPLGGIRGSLRIKSITCLNAWRRPSKVAGRWITEPSRSLTGGPPDNHRKPRILSIVRHSRAEDMSPG